MFIGQARTFLRDGETADNADVSRQVLLHAAAVCACDAVLLAAGFRVTSGDRGHALRLEKATQLLAADELLDELDDARLRRNDSSYGGVVPSVEDVGAAVEVTRELIERAQAFVHAADA